MTATSVHSFSYLRPDKEDAEEDAYRAEKNIVAREIDRTSINRAIKRCLKNES